MNSEFARRALGIANVIQSDADTILRRPGNDAMTLSDEYYILVDIPFGEAPFFPTETDVRDYVQNTGIRGVTDLCKLLHIEAGTHFYTEYDLDEWQDDGDAKS